MACGGQSRLTKTTEMLAQLGVTEDDVADLRYRGEGNPGPTTVRTTDGRVLETTYLDMWADESGWELETRCKLRPDALGECADIAAADAWPGGAPTGEDDGFNAVVVRTDAGETLLREAVDARAVVLGEQLTPAQLDNFQPHQVRKKEALAHRYEGVAAAGVQPIRTIGLRVGQLGTRFAGDRSGERDGATRRMREARRA